MSTIWPHNVKGKCDESVRNFVRPFECVMLMPFDSRFEQVSEIIKEVVSKVDEQMIQPSGWAGPPKVKRLDWVTSSGVIQEEIWQAIADADLIFCDITGFNPNVMFEAGVCAAWKELEKVVFIKDKFFRQQPAFDISPKRYLEYELTSDGLGRFQDQVARMTVDVMTNFPDSQGEKQLIETPLAIDFSSNRDDSRIYTPPFSHRRMVNGTLEFGSLFVFSHSWASIGKQRFDQFSLKFTARFSHPVEEGSYIGVGLRSQHYYANFGHILYLRSNGSVVITQPNEEPPAFYGDQELKKPTKMDEGQDHHFSATFDNENLRVEVDDASHVFKISTMKKVFGPGLIRFQSFKSWMAIKNLSITR